RVRNLLFRFTTRATEVDRTGNRGNRLIVCTDGRIDQLHELDQPVEFGWSARANAGPACAARLLAEHQPRIDAFSGCRRRYVARFLQNEHASFTVDGDTGLPLESPLPTQPKRHIESKDDAPRMQLRVVPALQFDEIVLLAG